MKLSLNWIRDFVEIDPTIPTADLVEKITLSVCEVEHFQVTGKHLASVLVTEVMEINPHPNSSKLSLVKVATGNGEVEVVCGASNFQVGDKVAYVGIGVSLPNGITIKSTEIRGIVSNGMLCAEDELGFSEDHEGLMILPANAEVGTTLEQLFPDQIDVVLEIDNKSITHRPDLWGHYGFAREISTLYRKPLQSFERDLSFLQGEGENPIQVEVKEKELVPRFSGVTIDGVRVGKSPLWMQYRLSRVGLRPINSLVDVTNYVMLEFGQPMHAFDAQQIPGNRLTVQLSEEGQKLMTLYKKEAVLTPQDMTICDANGPSVVAGVIGGLNSGVNDETTSIFFEAANWNPVSIRKTSTHLGLRTDACQRYEKSLDPEMTVFAILRATRLLQPQNPELKVKGSLIDIWGKRFPKISIDLSHDFLNRRLGKEIAEEEVKEILTSLGFTIEKKGEVFHVQVPTHRGTKDVSLPEDLVEEIGRIHGFNAIKPAAPHFPIEKPTINYQRLFERKAKSVLADSGFFEVYTYPLTSAEEEAILQKKEEGNISIVNPVAENHNQMRTSLIPHFLKAARENQKDNNHFNMFEVSRVYQLVGEKVEEKNQLILGISRNQGEKGASFYLLKRSLTNLLAHLEISDVQWNPLQNPKPFQHAHIGAEIFSGENSIGSIFSLSPESFDQEEMKGEPCFALLEFDLMFSLEKKGVKFQPLHKYPPVNFDLSLMVPLRTYFQEVRGSILSMDEKVTSVHYSDVFYPKETPDMKSMTFSIQFRSEEKTLDSEEVKVLQDNIVHQLGEKGIHLREK